MTFEQFVSERGPALRAALVAAYGPDVDIDQASTIAEAMRPATAEQLATMRSEIRARLQQLPLVDTVTIGTTAVELRGGTAEKPDALCIARAEGPRCEFNDIRRDDGPGADTSWRPLLAVR